MRQMGGEHRGRVLVEDGDTAQRSGKPFLVVLGKLGMHRLQERADEGCLPCRADNGPLVPDVFD
jgi:hypothetical protein